MQKIDSRVEQRVQAIIEQLKKSHNKFEDPDFGPTDTDEHGALSFYGSRKPDPAGSKYPSPETLQWKRPQYDDNIFAKEKNNNNNINDNNDIQRSDTTDDDAQSAATVSDGYEDEDEEDDDYGYSFKDSEPDVSAALLQI
jgi:hypothetical protein